MSERIQVGFLGAGNMGAAIMKGIAASDLADSVALYAYNPTRSKVEALADDGVKAVDSEAELVSACQYVFLAIKPQKFEAVLPKLKDAVTEQTVLISIAAGISGAYIQEQIGFPVKVVLAMPNTPLLLREGATALASIAPVSDSEFQFVQQIFNACGKTAVLQPDEMQKIIAINGSSPAFIYLYAKGFFTYAQQAGLDETVTKDLLVQSLIGAAKMIADSGYDIDTLIRQVSSPGGTTLAGLDRLYEGNLVDVVVSCCESCTKRAEELSK